MVTEVLESIEPFAGDTFETVHYVSCDWCYETATDDIYAGKIAQSEWRQFYRVHPGGEVVCEHCLPKLRESD